MENNPNYLQDLNFTIEKLLISLWEEPKIVAKLLINSDIKDVRDNLASFICNNFFQNILSTSTIEDNLLYVITLMLNDEINKLSDINQSNNFLEKTPCGYLLEKLREKSDIQEYSKSIIINTIEKIEISFSKKKINLNVINIDNDIINIVKDLQNKKKGMINVENIIFKKQIDNSIIGDDNINEFKNMFDGFKVQNQKQNSLFNEKFMPNLTNKELKRIETKYENEQNMKDFLSKYIQESNNNENLFSNEKLIEKAFTLNYSSILIILYQIDFLKLIELLDLLIDSFLNNIELLPKSLKYICKIISILVQKKFPQSTKLQQNSFINKFLFVNLLIPIFNNPYNIYINDFIISENALYNLKYLLNIFNKLFSGNLYTNTDDDYNLTPFNWYFIDKIPKIFEFYDNIIKIKLPNFIEKIINEQSDDNYKYEYFNENPQQIIAHRSILFSLNDLSCLIKNINNCKHLLFPNIANKNNDNNKDNYYKKLLSYINKLNTKESQDFIKMMKSIEEFEIISKNEEHQNILLFEELLINPKYKYLFRDEERSPNFSIKELKHIDNEEKVEKNNIIKVKNYISGLLYNCIELDISDFYMKNNTLDILKTFKVLLKRSDFVLNDNLPYEWYVNSLLDCLKKIPKQLSDNDYEQLYNELENDINESIEKCDFFIMSNCLGKIKYAQKATDFYKKAKNNLIDIQLNLKLTNFIENNTILSLMTFVSKENKFDLISLNNAKKFDEINEKHKRLCYNINNFINCFPNLVKMKGNNDVLKLIEEMKIPSKINKYINKILDIINKSNKYKKEEFMIIKDKLIDYIFTKLYDKICPINLSVSDLQLLENCCKLSWTESRHFFESIDINDNNNYDIFMNDIKQYFIEFEKEKSPRKKFLAINRIYDTINKIFKFKGESSSQIGADILTSILLYIFVRVQPKRIITDINYVKLFVDDNNNNGIINYQITHLNTICAIMKEIKPNYLIGVTEQEFNQKCEIALRNYSSLDKDQKNEAIS